MVFLSSSGKSFALSFFQIMKYKHLDQGSATFSTKEPRHRWRATFLTCTYGSHPHLAPDGKHQITCSHRSRPFEDATWSTELKYHTHSSPSY